MALGLPAGTVTLVLGDVEASTERWEASRDDMRDATSALAAVLDQLVAAHAGARPVEQGEGDSFVAAFGRAGDAMEFAVALQRDSPLPLRIGIHTGDVDVVDGGYAGPTIIRAARIRDAGHGGQILLSQTTAGLVADFLDESATLADLGQHHLKGLTRPERVWQLRHDNLPAEFPALRLSEPVVVPPRPTAFVGRGLEMAHVRDLTKEPGCVTVTGAGGAGKTRLALELIAERAGARRDGWFVDLAAVLQDDGVATAVADAVGARVSSGRSIPDTIASAIRDKDALIVLDNCEHLLAACGGLAADLLQRCPSLTILATSREPLGLAGEVTYRLPSLANPEAVDLFVERARRANPRFELDENAARAVAEICARLDGMPLAIELAAARIRVFSASQLLDALHDRFRLLTGGARTSMPRQRTLEASVDWSYRLLLDAERTLLRRLSVFAGGFTVDAAVAVASDGEVLEAHHIVDLLVQLVDKSLVTADERAPDRFTLLETIRHFAANRLMDERDLHAVRRRHYEFFTALVRRRPTPAFTQQDWIDVVTAELANLRRALQWATDQPGYEPLLRLAGPMFSLWHSNSAADGLAAYTALCERTVDAPAATRARVLCQRSRFGFSLPAADLANLAEQGVALARTLDDDRVLLACLLESHGAVSNTGSALDEAIALATRLGDDQKLATAYTQRGFYAMRDEDDLARGTALLERGIELARRTGMVRLEALADSWIVQAHVIHGDVEVVARADRAASLLRRTGERPVLANQLALTAIVRDLSGDHAGADRDIAELDAIGDAVPDGMVPFCVAVGHGLLGVARGEWDEAITRLTSITALSAAPYAAPMIAFLTVAEAFAGHFDLAEEHLALIGANASLAGLTGALAGLARAVVALGRNDVERAWELAFAGATGDDVGFPSGKAMAALLAQITARLGKHDEAARLAGAAGGDVERTGLWAALLGDVETRCRAALGDARFAALWAEGQAMGDENAIALLKRGRGSRKRPMLGWDSLTPTEADVARLVAQGLSNKVVAAQLFMSEATVKTHLTRIYAKVGVRSRAQLAHKYDV